MIHARTVDADANGERVYAFQRASLGVDAVDGDGISGPITGGDQIDELISQGEAVTQVNIIELAIREELQLVPGKIVHAKTAILVGADHKADGGIGGMDPDGGVIGGVAGGGDGFGLCSGDNRATRWWRWRRRRRRRFAVDDDGKIKRGRLILDGAGRENAKCWQQSQRKEDAEADE